MKKLKKKSPLTMAIDPGQKGGIALIKKGKLLKCWPMPLIGGKVIDIHALDDIFQKYGERITHVWLEKVGAMPKQGVTSMFNFGFGCGILQGIVVGHRIPFTLVTPGDWQKEMFKGVTVIYKKEKQKKVRDTKAMSIIAAKRLFPKESFIPPGCRTPKDGLTDATLMALFGYKKNLVKKKKGKKNV